mgnify:CR=1 FL=1
MLLQHFIVISCVAGIIATTVRRLLAFCGVDVHKANAGFLRLQLATCATRLATGLNSARSMRFSKSAPV